MKTLQISAPGRAQMLATRCHHARTMLTRLVGLLNHDQLAAGEGMLIEPCKQVHTLFMRFAIDVVFLDARDEVLGWSTLKPWRLSALHARARRVLELPAGTCAQAGLKAGERLEVAPCFN